MLLRIDRYCDLDERKLMDIYTESNIENTDYFYPDETNKEAAVQKVEAGFLAFLQNDFFRQYGASYWILEEDSAWVSALRTCIIQSGLYYLEALETRPDQRQKGYGSRLLSGVVDTLKAEGPFQLCDCVSKKNRASLKTHEKCGFRIVSEEGYDYLQKESSDHDFGLVYCYAGDLLTPGKHFPGDMIPPTGSDILAELAGFGFNGQGDIRLIDTSHGADDIRLNYIIDRRWVLRFCIAPDMTEKRLQEMNRLIERYICFGLKCPRFQADSSGKFFHQWKGLTCYLSEYIDLPTADELKLDVHDQEAVWQEVLDSVAGFAERYRNVDLSETTGMYSLFDLSPFDKAAGKDEKQQNFESLCSALGKPGKIPWRNAWKPGIHRSAGKSAQYTGTCPAVYSRQMKT